MDFTDESKIYLERSRLPFDGAAIVLLGTLSSHSTCFIFSFSVVVVVTSQIHVGHPIPIFLALYGKEPILHFELPL